MLHKKKQIREPRCSDFRVTKIQVNYERILINRYKPSFWLLEIMILRVEHQLQQTYNTEVT